MHPTLCHMCYVTQFARVRNQHIAAVKHARIAFQSTLPPRFPVFFSFFYMSNRDLVTLARTVTMAAFTTLASPLQVYKVLLPCHIFEPLFPKLFEKTPTNFNN